MVHSAYDSIELVKGCPSKIESVASYNSKLFLGCSDCSLRIYSAAGGDGDGDGEIRREAYSLERTMKGFWRKAPVAMEVCRSRDLLLSLSEWIAVHRLPDLETVVAIGKTKGCNVYSWDDRRGFLAVGRQKRVGIYRLDGGREFVEVKEFGVPDVVKSMAWCGENICLGIKKDYMIMNSVTGALSEVFPCGRLTSPLVIPLPSGNLLLGKDNIGVFVDQNGKLLQDGRICWSEAPTSVVIHKPYAVGRLSKHVEIRSLRTPYPLVQTVVLRDVHLLLQSNNCVLAALSNSIYGLLPVPFGAQIVQLTASGDFEEALALCKLLPPEDSSLRASKESSIHIRVHVLLQKRGQTHISSVAREMATILDTALIQALLHTGQSSAALELLKGPNYCDLKICEEFLKERNSYPVLLELYRCNGMHPEALKLLHQLVEESNSGRTSSELTQKFKPDMIIDYLKPLCKTDPMLVLEFSTHVLESCPTETIELFLSGNIPADLVNSYLKQHAPNMQSTYLELMLSMSENGINTNLLNELVQIYLSEVVDWYKDLNEQKKWEEKAYSPTRMKLLSALESISGYNAETLLKRLPSDALYEERALLLGKMNQHQLALSLYVHKLHLPELALAYCDRVYGNGLHQPSRSYANIYITLLQIYLNPRRRREAEQKILNPVPLQTSSGSKVSSKSKWGRVGKKIAEIEGADDIRISPTSTDSGRSDGDGDEMTEEGGPIMLNEALDLLSKKWDRINGAQALKLLPRATKLQNLFQFLEPLLRTSSEGCRNYSVIKSLRYSENLQVKEELYKRCRTVVKIDGDSTCSLCSKKIGSSAFAVYPNGKTLVHFVCLQNIKGTRGALTRKNL